MTTVYKIETIVKRLPELEQLCSNKASATTAFNDACKAVAENSGIEASVIKKYVAAVFGEKLEAHKQKAEQLQLLFDEIPEG
jgi:hypothetical protein